MSSEIYKGMTTADKIGRLAAAIAVGSAMAVLLFAYDVKALLYGFVIAVFSLAAWR